MGMLVTLCLITANIYGTVEAPAKRGFSYLEIWMCGVQLPIVFAIVEYAHVLSSGAYDRNAEKLGLNGNAKRLDKIYRNHKARDRKVMVVTLILFVIFNVAYWQLASY